MHNLTKHLFSVLAIVAAFSFSSCDCKNDVTPTSAEAAMSANKYTPLEQGDRVMLSWSTEAQEFRYVRAMADNSLDPNMTEKSAGTWMKTHVIAPDTYAFSDGSLYVNEYRGTVVMGDLSDASLYRMGEDNSLTTASSSAMMWVRNGGGIINIGGEMSIDKRKIIVILEGPGL